MAWLARCKNCLINFPVTKDSVRAVEPQNNGHLVLACTKCGWVEQYLASDLQPAPAEMTAPIEFPPCPASSD
jgi:RNase P subunit RPR2